MKKHIFESLVIVIIFYCIFTSTTFSQESGWVEKDGYLEQKLKVGAISFIRYSKNGNHFYTFSSDSTYRVWDTETGKLLKAKNIPYKVNSFSLTPDGHKIAVAIQKKVIIFDVNETIDTLVIAPFEVLDKINCGKSFDINAFCIFDSDSTILIGGNSECDDYYVHEYSGVLSTWNVLTGQEVRKININGQLLQIKQSVNKKYFIINEYYHNYRYSVDPIIYEERSKVHTLTQNYEGLLNYYNVVGPAPSDFEDYTPIKIMKDVYISNDSKYCVGLYENNELYFWYLYSGEFFKKIKFNYPFDFDPRDITFTKNNQYFITASYG